MLIFFRGVAGAFVVRFKIIGCALTMAVASCWALGAGARNVFADGSPFVGPVDLFNPQSMFLNGHFLGPVDMLSGTTGDSGSGLIISTGTTTYAGGAGTLNLNNYDDGGSVSVGANTYTGTTTVNSGTLILANDEGLSGGTIVTSGALNFNNNYNGGSTIILASGAPTTTGTLTLTGSLTGRTSNVTINPAAYNLTTSGNLIANQGLIQTGTGNLILGGTSATPYTIQMANGFNLNTTFPSVTTTSIPSTVVINAGALSLNSPQQLSGTKLVVNVPTTLTFSQGTLNLSDAGTLDSSGNETLTVVQVPEGNGPIILPLLPGTYDVTDPISTDPTILTDGSGAVVGQLDSGSDPSSTDAGSGDADGTGAGLSVTAAPEPAGMILAGCGLAALVFARRRMNRQGR